MISKFQHRATGITLHVMGRAFSNKYDVTFRKGGKVLGTLEGVGTPRCRTHDNRNVDDDRLAAQAAMSFAQIGPCASKTERDEDPSLQVWQDLTDAIGDSIYGDRQLASGEDVFWLRRIG